MNGHLGLAVARFHGSLVCRPSSDVFHVYVGPLTQTGRWVPRSRRPVCNARTRRLSVLERDWSVLDLGGRRMCGRCSARLTAAAGRAEQPVSRDACRRYYEGIRLGDLVTAVALAQSSDEVSRISFVSMLLFGPSPARRPMQPSRSQALYDFGRSLAARRRELVAAERTPEEIEANRQRAEIEAHNDALARAGRNRAARLDKLRDRAARGGYLTGAERHDLGLTG